MLPGPDGPGERIEVKGMKLKRIHIFLIGVLFVVGLSIWQWIPENFGTLVPATIPEQAVIAEGAVIESKEAIFDNGKGYIVVVESDRSFEETVSAIREAFSAKGVTYAYQEGTSSGNERIGSFDAEINEQHQTIEVVGAGDRVTVNHAIHMGTWFLP
jgi:hypothetical protein